MAGVDLRRPEGVDQRRLGAAAAGAVAVAAWCAAAAGGTAAGWSGLALAFIGVVLAAAAGAARSRDPAKVLRPGGVEKALTVVTAAGLLGLFLAGWADIQRIVEVAKLLPVAIVGLSVLWPAPKVLRYCLLLAVLTLLAGAGGPAPSVLAVGGAVVGIAAALVLTNRLTAAGAPRLGDAAPAGARRVAREAAIVLVSVGLLAALAASLLPPPPGSGGGDGVPGPLPQPAAPAVHFDDQLDVAGGRGKPGDEYVLLVAAREPDVWRALTYDHWDGETWSRSDDDRFEVVGGATVRPGIGDPETTPSSARLFQSVTVLARSADVLPAAPVPTFVAISPGVAEQGVDASLYPASRLGRGGRYAASSMRPAVSDAGLRALGATPAPAVPAEVAANYLQLPEVAPRVRALAADLSARQRTTFDTARALEAWIDGHTTVTDEAAPVPAGADALETFLLDDRAGTPERAATAMVVMLRAVGVPARLAVGYLPGHRDGPDEPFVVRASDVHAWVEVWFPTFGWQRFDPTGRAPDPRPEPDSVWDRLLRFLQKLWPLVAILLLAGAWRLVAWRRRRAALPWATRYFGQLERAGRARGRPRRPPETPAEYARALSREALPDPRLEEVGQLVTVAAWSRHEPPAEDRARAEAVLRAAKKAAPVRRLRRRGRGRPTIARP